MNPDKRLGEADFILAEVDNLIASTEKRIEGNRTLLVCKPEAPKPAMRQALKLRSKS